MEVVYLALTDIADIGGHPLERLKARVRTGNFPPHDGRIGVGPHQRRRLGWLPATVAEYLPENFSMDSVD